MHNLAKLTSQPTSAAQCSSSCNTFRIVWCHALDNHNPPHKALKAEHARLHARLLRTHTISTEAQLLHAEQ